MSEVDHRRVAAEPRKDFSGLSLRSSNFGGFVGGDFLGLIQGEAGFAGSRRAIGGVVLLRTGARLRYVRMLPGPLT
jgi:hypothetical protein